MTEIPPPTRLCCGQRHLGSVCPDGKVMCCICFSRFEQKDLYRDIDGDVWDVCRECGEHEESMRGMR